MFEDSLLESGRRFKSGRRRAATLLSLLLQAVVIAISMMIPLIFTQTLPTPRFMTLLVAPPPPPPVATAVRPASVPVKVVKTGLQTVKFNGALHTPTKIPKTVEIINEGAPPPSLAALGMAGGVPGGVPGGTAGGQIGGVLGGILSSVPVALPKVVTPQRLRVSQGVQESKLEHKIIPAYPPLARQARIQGKVVLQAVISKSGSIENLRVVQGHPMLAPSAVEAVRQWKYKPTYLNGEPVEVETVITVNFTLAGG